jgi:hypothetical protein
MGELEKYILGEEEEEEEEYGGRTSLARLAMTWR